MIEKICIVDYVSFYFLKRCHFVKTDTGNCLQRVFYGETSLTNCFAKLFLKHILNFFERVMFLEIVFKRIIFLLLVKEVFNQIIFLEKPSINTYTIRLKCIIQESICQVKLDLSKIGLSFKCMGLIETNCIVVHKCRVFLLQVVCLKCASRTSCLYS